MNPLYKSDSEYLVVGFSLRYLEDEERLHREQTDWCGFAQVEKLAADCGVLIIRPGAATELAP
jgi:hypothetical protein